MSAISAEGPPAAFSAAGFRSASSRARSSASRRSRRAAAFRWCSLALCASSSVHVLPFSTMSIASMGQAGRQSAQPVQRSSTMPCRCLGEPAMASVGQTRMHQAQPMQSRARMRATAKGTSRPYSGSSGTTGRPVAAARRAMPSAPPGAHRLMAAPSSRMARA